MTCDEVRELLPEHLLGTLDGPEDLEVRRHLRGCAGCRTDMAGLSEGVEWFARAAHDREPPPELHDRVMTTLEQEWRDAGSLQPPTPTLPMDRARRGDRGHRGRPRVGRVPDAPGEHLRRRCPELPDGAGHARWQGVPRRHAREADRAPARRQRRAVRLAPGTVVGDRARPRDRACRARPRSRSPPATARTTRRSMPARSSSRPTVTPPRGSSRPATSRRTTT